MKITVRLNQRLSELVRRLATTKKLSQSGTTMRLVEIGLEALRDEPWRWKPGPPADGATGLALTGGDHIGPACMTPSCGIRALWCPTNPAFHWAHAGWCADHAVEAAQAARPGEDACKARHRLDREKLEAAPPVKRNSK